MQSDRTPTIRRATADDVIDLRHTVLRAGLPRASAIFAGDDDPAARHFVAVASDHVIGCVTLHPSRWNNEPAWQLRGMAIEAGLQGGGIGRKLLAAAEQSVRDDPSDTATPPETPPLILWCNARVPAVGFYRRHGWEVVSDEFVVPTAGPHVKMIKRLGAAVR